MPVLVTGATGCVGRALVPKLVEAGGQVRVYVRRDVPEFRSLGVKVAIGDADHEGRLESALEQVHTLVHLVGSPAPERGVTVEWLNLETTQVSLKAAENAEVRRVLFLSPLGADPAATDPYLSAKGRAEDAVRAAPMEHVIFRSAPILGPGSLLARVLERGIPAGLSTYRLNPIAVDDVAEALVAADTRGDELRGTWELGGPEVLTFDDLAERFARRPRPRLRHGIPKSAVSLFLRDSVADPSDAVRQFGVRLRSIDGSG